MLALVVIAAVPLLAFAAEKIGFQRTIADDHAAMGHYGYMATFSFTVIGVGLLASLRPDGWRLTAWVAGLLPALLGLASLVFPDAGSSLSLVWALAAIAWGVVFVAAAELTQAAESPSLLGSRGALSKSDYTGDDTGVGPDHGSTASTPCWLSVFGIIGLVAILVIVIVFFTGVGGPGGHTPPIPHGP